LFEAALHRTGLCRGSDHGPTSLGDPRPCAPPPQATGAPDPPRRCSCRGCRQSSCRGWSCGPQRARMSHGMSASSCRSACGHRSGGWGWGWERGGGRRLEEVAAACMAAAMQCCMCEELETAGAAPWTGSSGSTCRASHTAAAYCSRQRGAARWLGWDPGRLRSAYFTPALFALTETFKLIGALCGAPRCTHRANVAGRAALSAGANEQRLRRKHEAQGAGQSPNRA
jgi:hypothetical protein